MRGTGRGFVEPCSQDLGHGRGVALASGAAGPLPLVASGPEAQCRCFVSVEFILIVTLFIEHGVCFYVLVLIQSCLLS